MTLSRKVVIITEAEYESIRTAYIGDTGMKYNPIADKYGNWTISIEEVSMSLEPFNYLKKLSTVIFEPEVIKPYWDIPNAPH